MSSHPLQAIDCLPGVARPPWAYAFCRRRQVLSCLRSRVSLTSWGDPCARHCLRTRVGGGGVTQLLPPPVLCGGRLGFCLRCRLRCLRCRSHTSRRSWLNLPNVRAASCSALSYQVLMSTLSGGSAAVCRPASAIIGLRPVGVLAVNRTREREQQQRQGPRGHCGDSR